MADNLRFNSDPDVYETDDIYLAAFFMLSACEYISKRKAGAVKVIFKFRNTAGNISALRTAFYSGQAIGKLSDYAQKLRAVKELLHD